MKLNRFPLQILAVILALPFSVVADEMLVITAINAPVTALTAKELKRIFQKEALISSKGSKWIPVNLSTDHPGRLAFSFGLFHKRPEAMEMYWNSQYFKGISPPYVVGSQDAMVNFVANTPGAIGYIFPCHLNDQIKIVARLEIKNTANQSCKH